MARPERIDGFSYLGIHRYFLTICADNRNSHFRSADTVRTTVEQFVRAADKESFAILAYCVMPDHTHWLVEGLTPIADFKRFVKRAKQQAGAAFALVNGCRLWQRGYYERVLRTEESSRAVARYILGNPVRAGLVPSPGDYPFSGSCKWTMSELLERIQN